MIFFTSGAATVAPVLLTLWDKVSSKGALLGAFAGIISVVIYGIIDTPSGYDGIQQYFMYLIHPTTDAIPTSLGGMTNLWVFVSAIMGSVIVTITGSFLLPDEPEFIEEE